MGTTNRLTARDTSLRRAQTIHRGSLGIYSYYSAKMIVCLYLQGYSLSQRNDIT